MKLIKNPLSILLIMTISMLSAKAEKSYSKEYYYLKITEISGITSLKCYLNGIPIVDSKIYESDESGRIIARVIPIILQPIDLYLIGENNKLEIVIQEQFPHDIVGKVSGSIIDYTEDEIINTMEPQGETIIAFEFQTGQGKVYDQKTFEESKEFTFNNTHVDFSYLLKESPPFTKEEAIRYAHHLNKLLNEKNTTELTKEFIPKFLDYSIVYEELPTQEQFNSWLKETFCELPETSENQEINAIPLCEGRIYLLKKGENAFLNRGGSRMDIYIAKVNDSLKIVR